MLQCRWCHEWWHANVDAATEWIESSLGTRRYRQLEQQVFNPDTPQFFTNKPLDLLLRQGVEAELFNRFKLGRTLDDLHTYGCDMLFSALALAVCAQEGLDQRFHYLDTTSFSLNGDYVPERDEQAMRITHGYAKDHRPDLKQAV